MFRVTAKMAESRLGYHYVQSYQKIGSLIMLVRLMKPDSLFVLDFGSFLDPMLSEYRTLCRKANLFSD